MATCSAAVLCVLFRFHGTGARSWFTNYSFVEFFVWKLEKNELVSWNKT